MSLTVHKLLKVTNTRLPEDGAISILLLGNGLINLLLEKVIFYGLCCKFCYYLNYNILSSFFLENAKYCI